MSHLKDMSTLGSDLGVNVTMVVKAAYSVTMDIFWNFLFSS